MQIYTQKDRQTSTTVYTLSHLLFRKEKARQRVGQREREKQIPADSISQSLWIFHLQKPREKVKQSRKVHHGYRMTQDECDPPKWSFRSLSLSSLVFPLSRAETCIAKHTPNSSSISGRTSMDEQITQLQLSFTSWPEPGREKCHWHPVTSIFDVFSAQYSSLSFSFALIHTVHNWTSDEVELLCTMSPSLMTMRVRRRKRGDDE